MTTFTRFDVTDYLDSEEMIAEYLSVAMEDPDPAHFLQAVAAPGELPSRAPTMPARGSRPTGSRLP